MIIRLRRELSRTACSLNQNVLVQSRTIEPAGIPLIQTLFHNGQGNFLSLDGQCH